MTKKEKLIKFLKYFVKEEQYDIIYYYYNNLMLKEKLNKKIIKTLF